jgi:hypothetical protein
MKTVNENEVRPLTTKELAALYKVSTKILRKWLQLHATAIGKRVGWCYTLLQVRIIFDKLGEPDLLF